MSQLLRKSHVASFALLCALALTIGCAPAATGGGEISFGPVTFQLPEEGADLVDAFTVTASGNGVHRVRIVLGQALVLDTTEGPFEYVIDAPNWAPGEYSIEISAAHSTGTVEERAERTFNVIRLRPPFQEMRDAITNLAPGEWYEIPLSQMRTVDWIDPGDTGRGNQSAIMSAASGGGYDTSREKLLVWGSGGGILRNDLYAFNMHTLDWERLTDPSPFPVGLEGNAEDKAIHNDGAPVARHSYDTVEYIPNIDRLHVGGGNVDGASTLFLDSTTFLFNFDTVAWTPGIEFPPVGNGSHAAVHPDGSVWQHGGGGGGANVLVRFDPVAQTFTEHAEHPSFYGLEATADIDPVRNLYVAVGNNETRVWDLSDPDAPSIKLETTGATDIEDDLRPGFVYHAGSDRFIAWSGRKDVYVLNMDTKVWTRVIGTGETTPGQQTARGQHGRWRYSPTFDVFVCVTNVDLNVFVYRLPANPDTTE